MRTVTSERGSVAAIVAVSLVAIMGFLAISVDVGRSYVTYRHLQGVVETAALAGVAQLPGDGFQAETAAQAAVSAAQANGVTVAAPTVETVGPGIYAMVVQASGSLALPFGAIIGVPQVSLGVSGAAEVGAPESDTGLIPLGVAQQDFRYGQEYLLRAGPGTDSGTYQEGNYGFLSLSGNGEDDDLTDLENGYQEPIGLGEQIDTKPGNMSSLNQALSERMAADTGATFETVASSSPRLLRLPVVAGDPRGRSPVTVVGFAAFFLEGLQPDQGGNVDLIGRFIQETINSQVAIGLNQGGLWAEQLIPPP